LEEKVQRLAAEFDKICGVFTSTSAQLAQWEFDVNKIIAIQTFYYHYVLNHNKR